MKRKENGKGKSTSPLSANVNRAGVPPPSPVRRGKGEMEMMKTKTKNRDRELGIRLNPEDLTDYVYIQNFRFNKNQIHPLGSLLGLDANDNPETRGNPLTPFLQVCIALLTFAGDNRQRILGLCGGISQFVAR